MQEGGSMRLEAMNISFQYDNGNRKILNNVSMSLESGERVGLKAPSGFGKTTFARYWLVMRSQTMGLWP